MLATEQPAREVARYPYLDERGERLYDRVRFEPKTFRFDPPLNGHAQVLYRLPELVASDGLVFIVEGEKDADRLRAEGVTATTSGSATSWRPEFAEYFRGRPVAIVPDQDVPGFEYARKVYDAVRPVAASVKVINLPLPEHGDVSDWLDDGGTTDHLVALATAPDPARPASFLTLRQLREQERPDTQDRNLIGDGLLTHGGKLRLHGRSGAGKSTALWTIAACLASGQPIFGRWPVDHPRRVLLLNAELDEDEMRDQGERLAEGGFEGTDADDNLLIRRETQLVLPRDGELLRALVVEADAEVLVLDTLNRFGHLKDSWRDGEWAEIHRQIDSLLEDPALRLDAYLDAVQSNVTGQRAATSFEVEAWPSTILRIERLEGALVERKLTFEKVRASWSTLNGKAERIRLDDSGAYAVVGERSDDLDPAGVMIVQQVLRAGAGQLFRKALIEGVMAAGNVKRRAAAHYLEQAFERKLVKRGEKVGREVPYLLVEPS